MTEMTFLEQSVTFKPSFTIIYLNKFVLDVDFDL